MIPRPLRVTVRVVAILAAMVVIGLLLSGTLAYIVGGTTLFVALTIGAPLAFGDAHFAHRHEPRPTPVHAQWP